MHALVIFIQSTIWYVCEQLLNKINTPLAPLLFDGFTKVHGRALRLMVRVVEHMTNPKSQNFWQTTDTFSNGRKETE